MLKTTSNEHNIVYLKSEIQIDLTSTFKKYINCMNRKFPKERGNTHMLCPINEQKQLPAIELSIMMNEIHEILKNWSMLYHFN